MFVCAFSALTVLAGQPEEHPACKDYVMWFTGVGMLICLEQRANDLHVVQLIDVTATSSSLASLKSRCV